MIAIKFKRRQCWGGMEEKLGCNMKIRQKAVKQKGAGSYIRTENMLPVVVCLVCSSGSRNFDDLFLCDKGDMFMCVHCVSRKRVIFVSLWDSIFMLKHAG